jgi:hypothetical protein
MIISLFMNDAPLRALCGGFRAGADGGPAGRQAGELPYRERKKQKFNHDAETRRSRWPRVMRGRNSVCPTSEAPPWCLLNS